MCFQQMVEVDDCMIVIQASAVAGESVFKMSVNLIGADRCVLSDEPIYACKCVRE